MNKCMGFAALALALASCGDGGTADQASIEVPEGNVQQRLEDMPERQRAAVFIRAIRDAGIPCQEIEQSRYIGEIEGQPSWAARCAGLGEHRIVIGRDGMASVIPPAPAG